MFFQSFCISAFVIVLKMAPVGHLRSFKHHPKSPIIAILNQLLIIIEFGSLISQKTWAMQPSLSGIDMTTNLFLCLIHHYASWSRTLFPPKLTIQSLQYVLICQYCSSSKLRVLHYTVCIEQGSKNCIPPRLWRVFQFSALTGTAGRKAIT